jgi:hypothetical protein
MEESRRMRENSDEEVHDRLVVFHRQGLREKSAK